MLVILPILLFIKDTRKLYAILTVFFLYMGLDGLSAFVQYYLSYDLSPDGRSGGAINGSVMSLAMLLTLAFPLALIAAFDKAYPWYVRVSAIFLSLGVLVGMWGNQSRGSWLFNGISSILITLCYSISNVCYIVVLTTSGGEFSREMQY